MKQKSLFQKPKPKTVPQPLKKNPQENTYSTDKNNRFTQPFLEKRKLTNPDDIKAYEEIQRCRLNLLVWSRMYYELDITVVDDSKFDEVGKRLIQLQKDFPNISKIVAFYEAFKDWDGSTGFYLPIDDEWVIKKTEQIISIKFGGK